jgi:hypothetical protein
VAQEVENCLTSEDPELKPKCPQKNKRKENGKQLKAEEHESEIIIILWFGVYWFALFCLQ